MTRPGVVITGVSTGIGYAATQAAIASGMHVFGSVRSEADAARMRADFPKHFSSLLFDVTDRDAIESAVLLVARELGAARLRGLVNNAGIVVAGPLLSMPMDEMRRQFDVNLFGVLAVTQAFAPLLGTDLARTGAPGRIVNVSSVSGQFAFPFAGPYVASKHALEGLSGSLRRELILFGIDVIVVGPGAIRTPIWTKSNLKGMASTPYAPVFDRLTAYMRQAGEEGLPVERCGELIAKILTTPRPRVRYALVRNSLVNSVLPRWLPQRWIDRVIAWRLGLKSRSATI